MAYMDQEKKAKIAAELKKIMPQGWKYTLGVKNHSTIVLNLMAAPVDLVKIAKSVGYRSTCGVQVNTHYMDRDFKDTEVGELFAKINAILYGCDYYDNSEPQTDYFDTAYYVSMNIGKWNKPFVYNAPAAELPVVAAPVKKPCVEVDPKLPSVFAEYNGDEIVIECDSREIAAQLAALLANVTFSVKKP
jgi:hypothetical protein